MKATCPTEHEEQKIIMKWFDMQYPALKGRLAAIPNGGQRHIAVAAKLKAEGVRKGFPDMMLLTPANGYAGLMIELKRVKGGSVSPEQADWLQWLGEQGFMTAVCKGADAARETIQAYLGRRA